MIEALERGDERALYQITRLYKGLARRMVAWLAAERFEDVFQETLLRVWNKRRLYDPARGSFRAWFFTVLRRMAADHARTAARDHQRRRQADALRALPDFRALRVAVAGLLRERRGALSELQWRVFLADLDTFPEKLSARELAGALGSTESSIRVQRSKACDRLLALGLPDIRELRRAKNREDADVYP